MALKLFRNARIFTPVDEGAPLSGSSQGKIRTYANGALLCRDGMITAVGEEREIAALTAVRDAQEAPQLDFEVIDCRGMCLIPGLVDPHTHMCFLHTREEEFILRLEGVEYLDILRRGGGILSSVRAVRDATEEELYWATSRRALAALRYGTTTLEIKSGYGLEAEAELRMLRIIARVGHETALDVVPTFMGAHAVPEEYRATPDRYVELVVEDMIPKAQEQRIARFCDVFCEEGVFSVDQSRRILLAARTAGLGLKIHADEVHDLGGASLAAELGAASAEHLLAASESGLQAMARCGVIAVLLPCTAYSLRKPYAPARRMIELGVPVAIATDCNPGTSYTESMPFVFGLSVLNMGLSISEALVASTLNGAYAIGMGRKVGSLQPGKQADFVLLDGVSPAIMAYHAGACPVAAVYKNGESVNG